MKEETKKLVKGVHEMTQNMSSLNVDTINKIAPEAELPEVRLTARQLANREGARYIEPKRRLQAFGKLPEKQIAEHARDWEYVKGIYENYMVNGEAISFWFSKYPGDPDCLWEIPPNVMVYVPRMIAKHLEEVQKYHTFDYLEKPAQQRVDDYTHQFTPTGTKYRGKFRPVGAFS